MELLQKGSFELIGELGTEVSNVRKQVKEEKGRLESARQEADVLWGEREFWQEECEKVRGEKGVFLHMVISLSPSLPNWARFDPGSDSTLSKMIRCCFVP